LGKFKSAGRTGHSDHEDGKTPASAISSAGGEDGGGWGLNGDFWE